MRIVKQTLWASLFTLSLVIGGCGAVAKNAATAPHDTAAPAITIQPASKTVSTGQSATFSVTASGTATLSYQWMKNGVAISGANSASYSTAATTASDKTAQFTVVVSNDAGSVTSIAASLTVAAPGALLLNSAVTNLNFGDVKIAGSNTMDITLTNAGSSDVTISQVAVAGAGFNAAGSNGIILKAGESTVVTSTFAPSATGKASGKVTVSSNASNSPASISLSGVGVTAASHSVALAWTDAGSGVTGFNAYASTTAGGPFVKMTATPLSSAKYTDDSVESGRTYYYVVTAINSSNRESAYSSEVTAIVP